MPDLSALPFEELVHLAKQGRTEAFACLCQRYTPSLCLYLARMIGNGAEAQDLAQETLLAAWKSLRTLEKNYYFKSWLYRIATNVAYRYLQRTHQKQWLSWEEHEHLWLEEEEYRGFEEQVIERMMLQQALVHVSPKPRACLLLYIVEDFQQKDIARIMGMDVKHVSTYIKRGLAQLSQAYVQLEATHGNLGKGEVAQ